MPDDSLTTAAQAISDWAGLAEGQRAKIEAMGAAGRERAVETLSAERFREALSRLA